MALISVLTMARLRISTPCRKWSAASQLLSSDRPIPCSPPSHSPGGAPAAISPATQPLSSGPHLERSRSVDVCPEGKQITRPSRSSSASKGSESAARATKSITSAWVMSLRAAEPLATRAMRAPGPPDLASSLARSTIPITSAPALSQNSSARCHGALPPARSLIASSVSKRHPSGGRATLALALLKVAASSAASSLNFFSLSASHSGVAEGSSWSSSQKAMFCTAAAEPASKRLPASAFSIVAWRRQPSTRSRMEATSG
mmetsp:Transcript_28223/g.89886  ORF Transcript_28223/g.89886 Transcript_28223/m.89886 type:complete len:260 (-) Transcript_28223:764-1543(-)